MPNRMPKLTVSFQQDIAHTALQREFDVYKTQKATDYDELNTRLTAAEAEKKELEQKLATAVEEAEKKVAIIALLVECQY